jgi:autotransporter-associated beta strand protein
LLNRLTETTSEIAVMTGDTSNNLDFSSSTGANLPNAFLGNWASNGAPMEYSGTLTPASDAYRLGAKGSNGLLAMVGTNKLTGARGLIVGATGANGIRVMLAGDNNYTGDTVINTGAKLTLGNNLALQNSALDRGGAGGNFALNNAGTVTNAVASSSPTFGGLMGSRNLLTVFTDTGGNNESNLAATAVTGFTLNPGAGKTCAYSGTIADFATGTTITKNGQGTQILSGANTYTGSTEVNQGTLLINNSAGSGTGTNSVTVNGGTLGGSGTISGSVTVAAAGNLSPGDASPGTLNIGGGLDLSAMAGGTGIITHELNNLIGMNDRIAVSGTLNIGSGILGFNNFSFTNLGGLEVGNYTLITSGGISGTLHPTNCSGQIGAFVGTLGISGNDLVLNISAPDTTPPTLISMIDDKAGSTVGINTLVTYTVTFSEDMDADTVSAADFGNAGTSIVTIDSVSETSPGVFAVEATPTTAGTLRLQINAAAVLKDIAGNDLNTAASIPDENTISVIVTDPYAAWSAGAAFDADTNGDGVGNGLAWLLGAANPNANASGLLPVVTLSNGSLTLTFSFLNAANRGGAALNIQHSSDLGISDPWTTVAVPETTSDPSNGVSFTITPNGNLNDVTATISHDEAASGMLFGRLKAQPATP